jgi:hypothetical protein
MDKYEEKFENKDSFKEDDLFKDDNVAENNWFKFKKVGDRIAGELVEISEKEPIGVYEAQVVYTLKQANGEYVKVGIRKSKEYVISRVKKEDIGRIVGFKFTKEVPSTVKGISTPAKSIEVYVMK